jgi:hypothetical protein
MRRPGADLEEKHETRGTHLTNRTTYRKRIETKQEKLSLTDAAIEKQTFVLGKSRWQVTTHVSQWTACEAIQEPDIQAQCGADDCAPIHDVLDEVLTPRYRMLISCNG